MKISAVVCLGFKPQPFWKEKVHHSTLALFSRHFFKHIETYYYTDFSFARRRTHLELAHLF